jgi:hypothetical protein
VDVEKATGGIKFQSESLSACWEEAVPLMQANYEETGTWVGPFNPDRKKFEQLENVGFLRVFTMRDGEKLVGYQLFIVMFGLNSPASLIATCHVAYVAKSHRGMSAVKFLHWADERLMYEGAVGITRHSTIYKPLDKLYERMKYHKIEESWLKLNPGCLGLLAGGYADGY